MHFVGLALEIEVVNPHGFERLGYFLSRRCNLNHPVRAFRHYWWITAIAVAMAIPLVIHFSKPENVSGNLASIVAGGLSVAYFVQKQRLEEIQLFERLFTRFNERYAEMNEGLQGILVRGEGLQEQGDQDTLTNYFSLCAEEYLFYSQGRILPVVWQSWCRGMLVYLANEAILRRWESEESDDSLYGLTRERIRQGAGNSAGS